MTVHYIEIVTEDIEATCAMYAGLFGTSFAPSDNDRGGARTAQPDPHTVLGVRAPLAEHETPIVRVYLAVNDIEAAVAAATESGGVLAYGPVRQGDAGSFAIVFVGGVQHGFWQR